MSSFGPPISGWGQMRCAALPDWRDLGGRAGGVLSLRRVQGRGNWSLPLSSRGRKLASSARTRWKIAFFAAIMTQLTVPIVSYLQHRALCLVPSPGFRRLFLWGGIAAISPFVVCIDGVCFGVFQSVQRFDGRDCQDREITLFEFVTL